MKTSPIKILSIPSVPKPGDFVLFRPWGETLENTRHWQRIAATSRWFSMDPEPKRRLVGTVEEIVRVGDEFYYRITSGMRIWDAAPETTVKEPEGYWAR